MHIQPLQMYMQDVPMVFSLNNFTFQPIQWLHVTYFPWLWIACKGGWNHLPTVEEKKEKNEKWKRKKDTPSHDL